MALYDNIRNYNANDPGVASPIIASVESSPMPEGNRMFFHVANEERKQALTKLLDEAGQYIISTTNLSGEILLVTEGDKPQQEMFHFLAANGENFVPREQKKKSFWLDPWAWRGGLSTIGQTLQLGSAKFQEGGIDAAVLGFAVPNLIANIINFVFGGQKEPDKHQLAFVKNIVNEEAAQFTEDGYASLPDAKSVSKKEVRKSVGEKFNTFIKRNSVTFGEIGLRLIGAVSLSVPFKDQGQRKAREKWIPIFHQVKEGNVKQALSAIKNPDNATFWAGVGTLIGKFIGFAATIPDPYAPGKKNWLSTIREKYIFKASSVTEGVAQGYMAYDRLKNKKINIRGKQYPDYLGSAGMSIFTLGYGIRLAAPFGEKECDMQELNAHAVEGLAAVPKEKLPEAIATVSARIVEHFRDQKNAPSFEQVYNKIAVGLKEDHQITPQKPQSSNPMPEKEVSEITPTVEKHEITRHRSYQELLENSRSTPASLATSL